jgi:hypothetical protein
MPLDHRCEASDRRWASREIYQVQRLRVRTQNADVQLPCCEPMPPVDDPLELLERRCWRGFLPDWLVESVPEEFELLGGAVAGPVPRGDA